MRWRGPGWVAGGAPQARRKSLRLRRVGRASRGPLNADVMPTNRTPLVREARASDAAELARLRWDFRSGSWSAQSREEFSAEFHLWFQSAYSSARWAVVVAQVRPERLCGCVFLQCVEKVPRPGVVGQAWGYVTNSFVDPEFRSQGLGGVMLRFIVDVARAKSLEFLIVWPSAESVAFYERAGFLPVALRHAGPGDSPPLELLLS
jgi:GNAT superfamily N-acetyltransferase